MIIDSNKRQIEDETLKIVPFPTLYKKKYLFFLIQRPSLLILQGFVFRNQIKTWCINWSWNSNYKMESSYLSSKRWEGIIFEFENFLRKERRLWWCGNWCTKKEERVKNGSKTCHEIRKNRSMMIKSERRIKFILLYFIFIH